MEFFVFWDCFPKLCSLQRYLPLKSFHVIYVSPSVSVGLEHIDFPYKIKSVSDSNFVARLSKAVVVVL